MQIQAVNERARRKYGEFVSAIDFVAEALESARHVIALMDRRPPSGGWTVATKGELAGMRRRTFEELDALRVQAMRGVPAYRQGFRKLHDQLARQAAELSVAMADARSMVNDD